MNKCTLVFLLSLCPSLTQAKLFGQPLVDSLKRELASPRFADKEDSFKVKLINAISFQYYYIDPDQGIKYGLQGLQLAEKLEWNKGIALLCNTLCFNYESKSDFADAVSYGLRAVEINTATGATTDLAANYGNLSGCYLAQADYKTALDYNLKALKLAEATNNKPNTALCYLSMGVIYNGLKDSRKSMENYRSALVKLAELNDKADMGICLQNMGSVYEDMQQYDTALVYHERALKIFEELGSKYDMLEAVLSLGTTYEGKRDFVRALRFMLRAKELSKDVDSKETESIVLYWLGETYLRIAQDSTGLIPADSAIPAGKQAILDRAIEYFGKSITASSEGNILDVVTKSHKALSEAYKVKGDYRRALEQYEAYSRINDSLFSSDNRLKIANLETKRETELKEKQMQINKLNETKKRNEHYLFFAGIGLLCVVIIVVVRNYNIQRVANHEKEALLRQKDILMKEIHHRVKNNLQVISALLDLQLNTVADEQAKDAMTESTARVKSISLIHQQLYQDENVASIEFSKFAADLLTQVASVFRKSSQRIVLKKDIPETLLDVDTAVPLGLILNELMTNSYKYAFNGDSDGTIDITLQRHNAGYRLLYKDSGPGLPAGLPASSQSLGMKVIHSLSKQVGGTFTYDHANKSFAITFKDSAGRRLID